MATSSEGVNCSPSEVQNLCKFFRKLQLFIILGTTTFVLFTICGIKKTSLFIWCWKLSFLENICFSRSSTQEWTFNCFPVRTFTQQERWYTQSSACKSYIWYSTLRSSVNPHWSNLLIQHCLTDFANSNVFTLTPSKFLFFEELLKLISLLQNKHRSLSFKPSVDIRLIVELTFEKWLHL